MSKLNDNNDYASHMNTVRQSWIPMIPDNIKAMFKAMPMESRFAHYARIDTDVNSLYNEILRFNREHNMKTKPEDILHHAAQEVISELN